MTWSQRTIWIILIIMIMASMSALAGFMWEHGRFPMGDGEIWNWLLGLGMISFRASGFGDYESCPRRFAARFLLAADLADDFGFNRVNPVQNNIGAVIGTAVHSGVAHLMRELKRTGEHGGRERTQEAMAIAGASVDEQAQVPIHLDTTTKSTAAAIATAHGMVARFHIDARPTVEPSIIESGQAALFPHPDLEEQYRVTGTVDLFTVDRDLWDYYTGRNRPNKIAQMGNYSILTRSNGHEVDGLAIKHALRVGGASTQPPIATIPIPRAVAERHALAVSRRAAGDIAQMLKTGDAEAMIANPSDRLCGEKYCPAYGTGFCRLGALVNPPRN